MGRWIQCGDTIGGWIDCKKEKKIWAGGNGGWRGKYELSSEKKGEGEVEQEELTKKGNILRVGSSTLRVNIDVKVD